MLHSNSSFKTIITQKNAFLLFLGIRNKEKDLTKIQNLNQENFSLFPQISTPKMSNEVRK